MNESTPQTRTVVIERIFAHPAEKIWRALTQPHLVEEWLMKGDIQPVPGHRFTFNAAWGSVECLVLAVEPGRLFSYSWEAMGLQSVVTWTLSAAGTGTHLRMEQTGFRPDQEQAYRGAQFGWAKFIAALENVIE